MTWVQNLPDGLDFQRFQAVEMCTAGPPHCCEEFYDEITEEELKLLTDPVLAQEAARRPENLLEKLNAASPLPAPGQTPSSLYCPVSVLPSVQTRPLNSPAPRSILARDRGKSELNSAELIYFKIWYINIGLIVIQALLPIVVYCMKGYWL